MTDFPGALVEYSTVDVSKSGEVNHWIKMVKLQQRRIDGALNASGTYLLARVMHLGRTDRVFDRYSGYLG
jgi:hypothetical protein